MLDAEMVTHNPSMRCTLWKLALHGFNALSRIAMLILAGESLNIL
jgi:hypothetical protein